MTPGSTSISLRHCYGEHSSECATAATAVCAEGVELTALGSAFDALHTELQGLTERVRQAEKDLAARAAPLGLHPHSNGWNSLRMEILEPHSEAAEQKAEDLEQLAERIRTMPAFNIQDLAVKARVLPFDLPMNDPESWPAASLSGFVAEVERLARAEARS